MYAKKLTALTLLAVSAALFAGSACDRTSDAHASILRAQVVPAAGAVVEAASYKVELRRVGAYKKGDPAAFEIVLTTKGDYHVNEEYPVKFKPADADGVAYAKPKLERAKDSDAFSTEKCATGKDNCTLRVKVGFTPGKAGTIKVGGTLHVGVCNAATCLIEKPSLELSIPVV